MSISNWFRATVCKLSFVHILLAALGAWTAGSLLMGTCLAEDLTTLDGKKYENIREIAPARDGIVFSYGPSTDLSRAKVQFKNLSDDLKRKYGYKDQSIKEDGVKTSHVTGRAPVSRAGGLAPIAVAALFFLRIWVRHRQSG